MDICVKIMKKLLTILNIGIIIIFILTMFNTIKCNNVPKETRIYELNII